MFFHIGELNLKTLKNRHIYLSLPAARIILEKLGKIQEIVVQKGYPPKRTLSRELLYTENFVVENEKYKLELMPPRENELHDFDMKLCIVQENIVKKKGSIYFIHAKAIPIFQENIAKILKEYEKLGTVSSNESKKSYLEEYYRISLDIQTELDIIQEDETKSFKERVQASDRIYMKYDEILKQLKKKYGIERKEVLKILPQSEERSVILETKIEIPKKKELSLKEEEKPLEYGNEGPKFW
uniref:Uncharacterized protein n=1 Tax=Acrobeloides nanus TaxID=290746 RepID=A0A914E9M7_9BILA